MTAPIDNLIAFIQRRRAELGLTQRQMAEAAGLNPGTLANIEMGRVTIAPSLRTLEKLARGLQVDVELLFQIARGEKPASHTGDREGVNQWDGQIGNPTFQELETIRNAELEGVWFRALSDPRFWAGTPDERRHAFRYLEGLIDESRRLKSRPQPDGHRN